MTIQDEREPETRATFSRSWSDQSAVPDFPRPDQLVITLGSLRELSGVRRQVCSFLRCSLATGAQSAQEDVVDLALLVIDELTSNALRHAAPPAHLCILDEADQWVVVVTDAAPHLEPAPAYERAAGDGGYGLHLIGELTVEHGVQYAPDHKSVWVRLAKSAG